MYNVLLVDDEPWILRGLRGFFASMGERYTIVGEAENGRDALALAQEKKPDLVISDIRMPDMDGLAFVAALREHNLRTRVIMLSGYAEFEYARQALQLNVDNYLLKPLDRRELQEALEKIENELKKEMAEHLGTQEGEETEYREICSIMEDIDRNFTREFTLNDLAEKYAVSISNLSGIIKRETGKTFTEHIAERRIKKAEQLLKNEKYSVAEVGKMVGYEDYYYFTKWFKKLMGVTPSKYRVNRKEKLE